VTGGARDKSWWPGAVVYQLYVRSWRDSDGDGFGDLPGVIDKLDYLSWLGVDAVWLSPAMPSPDHDWGYDVSDYMSVHPQLGSLADLDRLVAEAGRRQMRVLLDLVPNHTSDEHPWFVEARGSRDAVHRNWYVWAEPGPDGAPPNNWLDASGERAWSLDAATGQYYLHNFLPSQPDLNWWEPAVHDAFEEIIGFWFDRGVAGFRIDVAHGLYKDAALRDNPPMPAGQLIGGNAGQEQRYSANRPETHAVFRNWRQIAEQYEPGRLLLGETCVPEVERLARYYGQDDELQLAFNFPFMVSGFTAPELSQVVRETLGQLPAGTVPVWTMSNHDKSRFTTRWCSGDDAKAALALSVLLTLPGTIVIYYGDEIGMTDVEVPLELQRDDMFLGGRGGHPSRDRARTPMQWEPSATGGFTAAATTPWLPLGDVLSHNVADQQEDPRSLLSLCRRLMAVRRLHIKGRDGTYEQLASAEPQWVYRIGDVVVAANFSKEAADVPGVSGQLLTSSLGMRPAGEPVGGSLRLAGFEAVVVQRRP